MKYTGDSKYLSQSEAIQELRDFYSAVVANVGDDAYDDAYALRDASI